MKPGSRIGCSVKNDVEPIVRKYRRRHGMPEQRSGDKIAGEIDLVDRHVVHEIQSGDFSPFVEALFGAPDCSCCFLLQAGIVGLDQFAFVVGKKPRCGVRKIAGRKFDVDAARLIGKK